MRALTKRQAQIVKLTAEGYCRKEVGLRLGISPKTVESHFLAIPGRKIPCGKVKQEAGIYYKLGFNNVAMLTQWALKNGIAEWKV